MDTSSAKYMFQQRNERIDWRKLASVDVEKIARDVDVDAIQENIVNVTYCNVEHELGYQGGVDANVLKLFRLAQLTIEYLLHSQEFLQQCLTEKDRKLESFNEKFNESVSQCSDVKDELLKKKELYKGVKKELQKAKKLIGDYQLMVRSGASGLYKCTLCAKSFVSEFYLKSHVERRHLNGRKQQCVLPPPQSANVSAIQDEFFHNELDEIKSRLKVTEDELQREHENVRQLHVKEGERNRELLEILKQQEAQKHEEQEQIKAEMQNYKDMMMKELRETQKENEDLQKNLHSLHESTETWRKSTLGNLQDDEVGSNRVYEDFGTQIKELTRQLMETSKENEQLKSAVHKWKMANKKLLKDNNKYRELHAKVQQMENHFEKQFDFLSTKYKGDFDEAKQFCKEYVRNNQKNDVASFYAPDVVDAKPLQSMQTIDEGSISLWVSSNTSIMNCFRVSQTASSSKGDWNDIFSLEVFLTPLESFIRPVHVFTCGGSPYWRQYISLNDQLPAPHYKKEFTFYGSDNKLADSTKFFVLHAGSASVIRSRISKRESVDGWKDKGEHFYAMIPKTKRSLNRSSTVNSDVFQSVSDDEVSLSSLTGTDIAVKDDLAEALKSSRENLCEEDMLAEIVQKKFKHDAEDWKTEKTGESTMQGINEVTEEEKIESEAENEMFATGTSSSFLDSILPEKGQFYPFPHNRLAVARYNHSLDMVNAQREEMGTIVMDNLVKRGVDSEKMSVPVFTSKMRKHAKELTMIEKQHTGCVETRKRILTSIENYAATEFVQSKRGKWKSYVEKIVKPVVRFSDDVSPIKKSVDHHAPATTAATSTPKKQQHMEDSDDVSESESDSEWNSEELENQMAQSQNNHRLQESVESLPQNNSTSNFTSNFTAKSQQSVHTPHVQIPTSANDDNGDEVSDSSSSEWDSDELSARHLQDSANVSNDVLYNPKMRPPTGENVRGLAASLELTLGTRDSTKKIAGAVDLHPV